MKKFLLGNVWTSIFANNNDAFIPEIWAAESLMVLNANMVAANLIHRDFSPEVAQFGDVVNTRRPAAFKAKRKGDADEVTVQDATATNVAVPLNQHLHTSFLIKDGEESKGFKNLRELYLEPAIVSIAQQIDEIVLMQMYRFMNTNRVGKLGEAATVARLTEVRQLMTENKAPAQGRSLIITPSTEAELSQLSAFHEADKVGDDGSAMREGSLGRKFGMQIHMSQNAPTIASGNTIDATYVVDNTGGYAAGATTIVTKTGTTSVAPGSYCTIAGDETPQLITTNTDVVGSSYNTTATTTMLGMTISPGLKYAVADDAVITIYTPGAVEYSSNYAINYYGDLVLDTFTVSPKVGQLCSFGYANANIYGILDGIATPTTALVTLDRPLAAAITDEDLMGIGPAGNYNFAFHKNALALVSRPLAIPAVGTGALSAAVNIDGIGVRVTITYDGTKQGHLVTVDLLCGVQLLDVNLGCVLFS